MPGQYVLGFLGDFFDRGYPDSWDPWNVETRAIYYVAPGQDPELAVTDAHEIETFMELLNKLLNDAHEKGRKAGLREASGIL